MTRSPVTVTLDAPFKQVACALLVSDASAVPVLTEDGRPIGVITESDLLANLEYHGGIDPPPLLGGATARRRRRKAAAHTARELMSSPVDTIGVNAPISAAVCRLTRPGAPPLCVLDDEQRLAGLLTKRDLIAIYRRPDADIAANVRAAVTTDRSRPARTPADLTVQVENGVVSLAGQLTYRSQVQHAIMAASRVAGAVSVHSSLRYDIDDLLVTGF
ncbi:CBS domain-containing protein [Kribbella sp. VKM Ac-2500]|nr:MULTISPECIES: CBS domain-containing protein [Kribbella]